MIQQLTLGISFLLMLSGILHAQASEYEVEAKPNEVELVKPDGTFPKVSEFSEAQARQGKQNINVACSRCHGKDGRGGKGPDLTDGVFRRARSDKEIIDTLTNGIPGTSMPGFGPSLEAFYIAILHYVRLEGARNQQGEEKPEGDPVHGKLLFEKFQCGSCHWTGKAGGRRGTNLANVTATPRYIRDSMRYPNEQVDGSYQQVTLVDDNGTVHAGTRLSETTYDILIMDAQENLKSFDKQQLEGLKYESKSLMPSFRDLLSTQDIEDITSYLLTPQRPSK